MSLKVPDITPEGLVELRVKRCQEKINKALEEENCSLDASITISSIGVQRNVRVVPLKDKPQPPLNA